MNVNQARELARQWVIEEAAGAPGFHGAYLAGSTMWLPDEAELAATSDVDVTLVSDAPKLPEKPGKFMAQNIVLDVSWMAVHELRSPDLILGNYHLAGSFRKPNIVADPSGDLTKLNEAVARDFAKLPWVALRCDDARNKVLRNLGTMSGAASFPEQVLSWLFPTGVTTHVLLVAGLRNPTIRQRYVAVRNLLDEYGRLDVHEILLEMLGCAQINRTRVEHHLDALAIVFDAVKGRVRSPFPFASDLNDFARPIAIDGSWDLIARGFHREAMFWIVATYSRCLAVIRRDLPHLEKEGYADGYQELLGDLEITSYDDLQERAQHVIASLPWVMGVAEEIMLSNPEIRS